MSRLAGSVALVTGGISGFGEAAARLLAREGASVGLTNISDQVRKKAADPASSRTAIDALHPGSGISASRTTSLIACSTSLRTKLAS